MRRDAEGEILWQRFYEGDSHELAAHRVAHAPAGGFFLAGSRHEGGDWDAWVGRLDRDGPPLRRRTPGRHHPEDDNEDHPMPVQDTDGRGVVTRYLAERGTMASHEAEGMSRRMDLEKGLVSR